MIYRCDKNGWTVFEGRSIRYTMGEGHYPPGALDHVSSAKMIQQSHKTVVTQSETKTIVPENAKPLDGTVSDIKDWLDKNNVEYSSTARKPELLKILKEA